MKSPKAPPFVRIKQYIIGDFLGSGAFGDIFSASHQITQEEVAIKLELKECKFPQLFYENRLYKKFHSKENIVDIGIPRVYEIGIEGHYNYMVMDILG